MADILINLGIDFGTRFTKVCAYSAEAGATVVDFGGHGAEGAIIPSIVNFDSQGAISVPGLTGGADSGNSFEYLKMALADRGQLGIHAENGPMPDGPEELIKPISAFFLATVFLRSKRWLHSQWRKHIGNRYVIWSANVGLPVEYVDSDIAPAFQEVVAVAWKWAEEGTPPRSISEVKRSYFDTAGTLNPMDSHCQAYPEIAAAIMSFAMRRSTPAGVYVFFDVGGGTVDGVIFNLLRRNGEVRINFYSGHVEPLGVDRIAQDICKRIGNGGTACHEQCKRMIFGVDSDEFSQAMARYTKEVCELVGRVIWEGKRKDPRNWREENVQSFSQTRSLRKWWKDENVAPLKVFLGGGGSGASFYQKSILDAYERQTLRNYGVPPLELISIPHPSDLELRSVDQIEYHRFLIAHGLSVPFGEGPEFRLPSQFADVPAPPRPRRQRVPDYGDQKDIYD